MTNFLNRSSYFRLAITLLAALIAPSLYANKISAATAATAATAADAARTFELAEEISRNLKKSPSEFINSWPGARISTPNLKNEGTYKVSGGILKIGDHLTAKNSSISISADKKNIESVLLSLGRFLRLSSGFQESISELSGFKYSEGTEQFRDIDFGRC